ncbi:MAG TPA: hypothetical protein VF914_01950, partial [Chloroflexia bacterium]
MVVDRFGHTLRRYVFFVMLALFVAVGALLVLVSGTGTARAALPTTKSAFERPAVPQQVNATFVVTNTSDSGPGSLRQAIINANQSPGPDAIEFDIAAAGVQTITTLNALPLITDTLLIDGYSQDGATPNNLAVGDNAQLKIVLDNGGALGDYGLWFQPDITAGTTPSGSEVRGLVISNFANGVRANSVGDSLDVVRPNNIWVHGNFIGTDATGTTEMGNQYAVQFLDVQTSTIGGNTPAQRNLLSGNDQRGVSILNSSAITVVGNYIGTSASGMSAVPNGYAGVEVIASISTTIGGPTAGERNIISGNYLQGIELYSPLTGSPSGAPEGATPSSGATVVQGNYIGLGATGAVTVSNGANGIYIHSPNRALIGGTAAGTGNVISGNDVNGIFIEGAFASGEPARSEGPQAPSGSGVSVVIRRNKIGTDATGLQDLGNGQDGIHADSPHGLLVGSGDPLLF